MNTHKAVDVSDQVTDSAQLQQKTQSMNEALLLGSVRQHELTEAAESSNALLQAEIKERKRAEAALRKAKVKLSDRAGQLEELVAERTAELTASNRQLEALVYSIAHDLRSPLRVLEGYSALLVKTAGVTLNETGRSYVKHIKKSAHFMDALLVDLLAFCRVSQQSIALAPVDLAIVLSSVLARLQNDIMSKQADVKSSGPWPIVLADEKILIQVLIHLLSNALKFVKPGVLPVVRLWVEDLSGLIRVWVEDNGPGIASDYHEQIFRLFNRLDNEKYDGTGAGLAIVQKGVERMDGRVGIESSVGKGSRFWFELQKA